MHCVLQGSALRPIGCNIEIVKGHAGHSGSSPNLWR
jgi:hypothetical protein